MRLIDNKKMIGQGRLAAVAMSSFNLLRTLVLFLLVVCIAAVQVASAETPDCTVGDFTEGKWYRLPTPTTCPFKKSHDVTSHWPTDQLVNSVFSISGKYKIMQTMSAIG